MDSGKQRGIELMDKSVFLNEDEMSNECFIGGF
jgi:hypothetical protein